MLRVPAMLYVFDMVEFSEKSVVLVCSVLIVMKGISSFSMMKTWSTYNADRRTILPSRARINHRPISAIVCCSTYHHWIDFVLYGTASCEAWRCPTSWSSRSRGSCIGELLVGFMRLKTNMPRTLRCMNAECAGGMDGRKWEAPHVAVGPLRRPAPGSSLEHPIVPPSTPTFLLVYTLPIPITPA